MNIQDIARLTGFSAATVSRAINNKGYVREETRAQIFEIVAKHRYVPNAVARSLSKNESLSVGVIIPDVENEFFPKVMRGMFEAAERKGYHILYLGTNESIEREHSVLNIVEEQRLSGVIITPVSEEDPATRERLLRFKETGIPVVLVDRDIPGEALDGVFSDNLGGAYDGVSWLIGKGYRKIAMVTGPRTSKPGKERTRGYLNALEHAGMEAKPEYIVQGDFRQGRAYECTKELLGLPDPPDAIFTANNMTTLGCLRYLTERGLRPGIDMELLSFDPIDALNAIGYKLPYIGRDVGAIGEAAMKLLIRKLRKDRPARGRLATEKMVLPCRLVTD